MIVAGVSTGVGFSNLKNCRTRIQTRMQNFGTGTESESEKVTPATSDYSTVVHKIPILESNPARYSVFFGFGLHIVCLSSGS